MAFFIDEQNFVQDNLLKYDDRFNSPVTRFIDKTPTFTVYYHINDNESTTDKGYRDIEAVIGDNSPLRFQRIEAFPIYGLDQVVAQLSEGDTGLDVTYEGEAIILPNTIAPLPNDFFIIPYLNDGFIFRVTGIEYDNTRPNNFYKILFKLDDIDFEKTQQIEKQVHEKYISIFENIGSENKCIIQADFKERIDAIDKMYTDMIQLYLSLFYNSRYNILLGDMGNGKFLYDPYMAKFINKNKIFYKKNSLKSVYLEEDHVQDNKKSLKYEMTVYRFFERRDISLIKPFEYTFFQGTNRKESGFYKWTDDSIYVLDIPTTPIMGNRFSIFDIKTIETLRMNGPTDSKYLKLIQKFVRNEPLSIYDIELTMNDELIHMYASMEMFFITPLLLYVIKTIVDEFYKSGIASVRETNDKTDE